MHEDYFRPSLLFVFFINLILGISFGDFQDESLSNHGCSSSPLLSRYLFYDVNSPEGFNLRRDVFMRVAVFMKDFTSSCHSSQWHLVLPPWTQLYHWRSEGAAQSHLAWSTFFDVTSIKRFAPVLEMHEVLNEIKTPLLDVTLVLQNYKNAFTDPNWSWEDKWEYTECQEDKIQKYSKKQDVYGGFFWGYENVTSKEVFCVSFQGQASKLKELLTSVDRRLVMLDHAEIVLHDWFGSADYWRCRRSMRFAAHLVSAASQFRKVYFNSTDEADNTIRPLRWEDEKIHRNAVGGNYLSVHLRRRDFEISRREDIPSVEEAARQISQLLEKLQLNSVFLATDATRKFVDKLVMKLPNYIVLRFSSNSDESYTFNDGEEAIIDQIICSHARYFIGSYESTFSFRIQEEREILGFPPDTTFNRLCGSKIPCSQPTRWLITH